MKKLSHVNEKGKANMVDIGHKQQTIRTAKAAGFIRLLPETVKIVKENSLKKGEVLTIAEIAGILAGKQTASLIPLCHPLLISKIEVTATLHENGVEIKSFASCTGQTGIEMEALTAVSVALLTIYDMCKAVDNTMIIEQIRLIEKTKLPE